MANREIKFRAWDEEGMHYESIQIQWDSQGAIKWIEPYASNAILMQFTGLKDKNGKEIYEADIVRYTHYGSQGEKVDVVEWGKSSETGFYPFVNCGQCGESIAGYDYTDVEIVGTLYENPELLKK